MNSFVNFKKPRYQQKLQKYNKYDTTIPPIRKTMPIWILSSNNISPKTIGKYITILLI